MKKKQKYPEVAKLALVKHKILHSKSDFFWMSLTFFALFMMISFMDQKILPLYESLEGPE